MDCSAVKTSADQALFSPFATGYFAFMKITCPNCAVTYTISEKRLAAGQKVRCVQCGNVWSPLRSALEAASKQELRRAEQERQNKAAPPATAGAPGQPVNRLHKTLHKTWVLAAAWVLTFAILLLVIVFAILRRDEIMQAWPPSARAYSLFGHAQAGQSSQKAP